MLKLLDKKTVNAEVATQKKRSIDEGLNLAKKVDTLRGTLQEEEGNVDRFRKETLARVQREIDARIVERDSLERGNIILREDRIRLSSPIDLSQAWDEVNAGKIEVAEWKDRLTQQSIELLAREGQCQANIEEIEKEKENIRKKDNLAERNLTEAESKFTNASDTLERAEREADRILGDARGIEARLRVREEDATVREQELSSREESVQAHEIDLANREVKLRRNQEVFIKAQDYLKKK